MTPAATHAHRKSHRGRLVWRLAVLAAMCVAVVRSADAQTVTDTLTFLLTNQGIDTGSGERDRAAAEAASRTISRALVANLATLPVPTSSSGFVYRLNPDLGTVERVSRSFGPFFVERALTAGRGQASFGLTFQHVRFDTLGGRSLRDGTLVTTANQFVDEEEAFDVDRLTLAIDADVATLSGNVGIADWMEIGVAAPFVSLTVDGSRVETYRGRPFTQAAAHAHAIGLADLVLRTKLTLYRDSGAALAGAVDVRLPTGRFEDLLGAGSRSIKMAAIGSIENGRVSSHANAGVALGGLADEITYGGAVALAASGRVTIIGELLGRWIDSPGGITTVPAPHPSLADVDTFRLTADRSKLNVISLVPGFKWNLATTWVLAGNVSVPLTRQGLTASWTPFIGLDYSVGR
jgi:hypothetical protein